jgi:hypothetical protein
MLIGPLSRYEDSELEGEEDEEEEEEEEEEEAEEEAKEEAKEEEESGTVYNPIFPLLVSTVSANYAEFDELIVRSPRPQEAQNRA